MASLLSSQSSSLLFNRNPLRFSSISKPNPSCISFPSTALSPNNPHKFSSLRLYCTFSDNTSDGPDVKPTSTTGESSDNSEDSSPGIVDEWGEKTEPEPASSFSKLTDADPPKDEDEWGGDSGVNDVVTDSGNGSATTSAAAVTAMAANADLVGDLKRCLVDTVYGMSLGLDASVEVRAEVMELVNQLESANPTPAPTEATTLLDGNWVLLYTAFSELLPLLAAGKLPLLKVEKICQSIDTPSQIIVNSITLSSPFATFSFSASASFEVRSPSRIQVQFKEGTLQPPEITPRINLPESFDIFGQTISLQPIQQSLNPLQDIVANISRVISGQPSLKVPIPGERTTSWLLTTFLDEDLRISRGDGGIFILAKEGSPLLDLM